MRIAIIPARGGSKRIPKKNIKNFLGEPIIKYSIDAAKKSRCFDVIMVSTEDLEIAKIAKECGASVPFLRSSETANDHATLAHVLEEVLVEYKKRGKLFDYCCCILATAPFVSSNKIRKSFELLKETNSDSLVPVTQFSFPIQRAVEIKNSKIKMLWPKNYNERSQDLKPVFHDCGQFYWIKPQALLLEKKLYTKNCAAYVLPESESQDIDTKEDWKMAEFKYEFLYKKTTANKNA